VADVGQRACTRVRVVTVNLSLTTSQGSASLALSAHYFDFGPQPLVTAPPADEIEGAGTPPLS
jgi:hypothetical protein